MTRSKNAYYMTANKIIEQRNDSSHGCSTNSLQRVIGIIRSHGLDSIRVTSTCNHKEKLAKIERNLLSGKYDLRSPWKFISDVYKMFDSIQDCNSARSHAYTTAMKMKLTFTNQMDELMRDIGLCCGSAYKLTPRTTCCIHNCEVQPGSVFYRYLGDTFCARCFNDQPDPVTVNRQPIPKSHFKQFQCNSERKETFVCCRLCTRKVHSICVLHDEFLDGPFCCSTCCRDNGIVRKSVSADKIPSTKCDQFIAEFLKKQKLNDDDKITIRLLNDSKFVVPVDPAVKIYRHNSSAITARNWVLFTFVKHENAEICFFAVYVQLYGSDSEPQTKNTAYISYIDSVNILPSGHRTKIYHFILLGLFEYLKQQGYTRIYLWSCPPKKNNDYIFYSKPPDMKMPTRDRLTNWYLELFKLGIDQQVISSYLGVEDYCKSEKWSSIDDVPYIKDDLCLQRLDAFVEKSDKRFKELTAKVADLKVKIGLLKNKSTKTYGALAQRLTKNSEELEDFDVRAKVWEQMKDEFSGFNNDYFAIKLQPDLNTENTLNEHTETHERRWLSDRSKFIDFCCDQLLEFSSKRRAKFTTRNMVARILLEDKICLSCGQFSSEGLSFEANYPETTLLCRSCFVNKISSRTTIYIGRNKPDPSLKAIVNLVRTRIVSKACQEYIERFGKDAESPKSEDPGSSPDSAYSSSSSRHADHSYSVVSGRNGESRAKKRLEVVDKDKSNLKKAKVE